MSTTFGSVCSGIEAASQAFNPLGWKAAWFSEIDAFACKVLAHHHPDVPNLGDMRGIADAVLQSLVPAPEVLCGGTPCQSFSVAGGRASLEDERGNLTLIFCRIADAIDTVRVARGDQPCAVFWENVPGVLSTKDNAFGCFLGALAGSGAPLVPGRKQRWTNAGVVAGPRRVVAWRTLDAQFFGLAQRRRRVFVVASARAGFDPAAVLFESEGLRRDPPTRAGARQDVAPTVAGGARSRGGYSTDDIPLTGALSASSGGADENDAEQGRLVNVAFDTYNQTLSEQAQTLCSRGDSPGGNAHLVPAVLAFGGNNQAGPIDVVDVQSEQAYALLAGGSNGGHRHEMNIQHAMQVRRLTPIECERLQGFPDGYTQIPTWTGWRKLDDGETPEKLAAEGFEVRQNRKTGRWRVRDVDGPRYKALGNSWAVPCAAWVGFRLDEELSHAL